MAAKPPQKGQSKPPGSRPVLTKDMLDRARAAANAGSGGSAAAAAPAGAVGGGKYAWNGKGRHSIPQAQHDQNVQAVRALGGRDLTAPPTATQAYGAANAAADLQYGPQVQAARQQQRNVQPFFTDYLARVAGYQNAARAQAQPTLDQAQQLAAPATNPQAAQAQLPAGLDPNSDAGKAATLAAQGRAALAQLGAQALGTNAQATQDYFGGLGALAAREQPQAQTTADQGVANAESQRAAAVNAALATARQNAQNYQIARGTLNLNTDKAAADATIASQKVTQDAADKHAARVVSRKNTRDRVTAQTNAAQDRQAAAGAQVNKYGYSNDQWQRYSVSHRQRIIDAYNEKGGASNKDAAKHAQAITKAGGKITNQITDVTNYRQTDVGGVTDDTSPTNGFKGGKDPKTKQYPTRKVTQADVDREKIAKYGMLARIAIAVRDGRKLDQNAVDYLHNMDPNFRIPREWLPAQGKGARGTSGNAPSGTTGVGPQDPSQARPT